MSSLSIGCASMRAYVHKTTDGWIFLRSYLDFSYVFTGYDDSIYDTSIIKVVDIPCRNSPYYVAYTRTWIFEPSVYIKWLWDRVTSLCHHLLWQLASSIGSCYFSWGIDPTNTMAFCRAWGVSSDTEATVSMSAVAARFEGLVQPDEM
jgi:hypothetical protein